MRQVVHSAEFEGDDAREEPVAAVQVGVGVVERAALEGAVFLAALLVEVLENVLDAFEGVGVTAAVGWLV